MFGALRIGLNALLRPREANVKALGIMQSLRFYYGFSILPLILALIAAFAVGIAAEQIFSGIAGPLGFVYGFDVGLVAAASVIIYILVIVPVALLAEAAVLHFVGRLFGIFKGGYSKTLSAAVLGGLLNPALLWLMIFTIPFSIINLMIILISFLWGSYVLIVSLANLHRTTLWNALKVCIACYIIFALLAFVFVVFAAAAYLGAFAH